MKTKTCREDFRSVLAAVLLADPKARKAFNDLINKGAEDFYPGTFYFRLAGSIQQYPATDISCWFCKSYHTNRVYMMMRNGSNVWQAFETERLDYRLP